MKYTIPTYYNELTLEVTVKTKTSEKIRIKAVDATQPNTWFTDRYKTVNGSFTFFVRMPVSGETCILYVYNEKNGDVKNDNTFTVSIKKVSLQKKLDVIDFSNPYIRSFIEFSKKFAYNAGTLDCGIYVSDDKMFCIEYLASIIDEGTESTTPARIDINTGCIEISQKRFLQLSIPERLAILLHEFSHVYINDNVDDEVEADLNGLLIYLGLGYPRIEALEVFGKTFTITSTEENRIRYDKIRKFIDEFENYQSYIF